MFKNIFLLIKETGEGGGGGGRHSATRHQAGWLVCFFSKYLKVPGCVCVSVCVCFCIRQPVCVSVSLSDITLSDITLSHTFLVISFSLKLPKIEP